MTGHLQEEQLKKIEEVQRKKILRIQQNAVHDSLTNLQTWSPAEGQTMEEHRKAYRESIIRSQQANASLHAAAQAQMPQAQANAAAPGQPQQDLAPAKLTGKQCRAQAQKAKKAKKHCPVGTDMTYDCVQSLARLQQAKANAMSAVPKDVQADRPVLNVFSQGYQTNKKGHPATPEDQEKADSDRAFQEAYLSEDINRRMPYLEQFREELMDFPLNADKVSDAYLLGNAGAVKNIMDRVHCYQNMMKDPINKPYFDTLTPTEMALLTQKLRLMSEVGNYFVMRLGSIGVDCNKSTYYGHGCAHPISDMQAIAEAQFETVRRKAAGWKQQEQEIIRQHMEQDAAEEKEKYLSGENRDVQGERLAEEMNFSTIAVGYAAEELKRFRTRLEENPTLYAAHKPVLDDLYQELYRGMDLINETAMDLLGYQGVIDSVGDSELTTERAKAQMASQKQDQLIEETDEIRAQVNTVTQCLNFYLQQSPLTESGRAMLQKLGHYDKQTAFQDGRIAVRAAFLGESGVVNKSNAVFQSAHERGESPGMARSQALQALGIRTSNSIAAKADKILRGTTYLKLPEGIAVYFHTLEDGGTDLEEISRNMVKTTAGLGAYVSGGGVDAVNTRLLEMYGNYLNSEDSIRYLREMCGNLKDAQVFHGQDSEMLDFLSQCLINSYGANYTKVATSVNSYANGDAVKKVAIESCRTLLSLPAMTRMGQEERDALPGETKKLLENYEELLRQVLRKITSAQPDLPGA